MEAETSRPGAAVDPGNPLLRAVSLRRLRLTRLLLEGGAYINESDGQGRTPLMAACRTKHADSQSASRVKLVQFLLEKGADPNIQDKEGRSALAHACLERVGPEVVSLLLASGADVSLEDRSGTSALAHAVLAGDWRVLKLLLDTCKAKGKEVIIITTDKIPTGKLQYLNLPPTDPGDPADKTAPLSPASPSDVQLITSPRCAPSSLRPPKTVFSFKEGQICGVSSHPGSPSRFRGPGQSGGLNGQQQPLLRLNSEPWLKVPASLLTRQTRMDQNRAEDVSLRVPRPGGDSGANYCERSSARDEVVYGPAKDGSLAVLLSSHSASHPNLHSETLGPDPVASSSAVSGGKARQALASSSLQSIIQRRRLGADLYGSDPQLAGDVQNPHEDQRARDPADGRRLAPLRCASTLGSRESPTAHGKRVPPGYERRGSGTFLLDRSLQARPRSLPPLVPNQTPGSAGNGFSERDPGQRGFLPCAPPGHPKEVTRRMLLRRHSIQTEQFKTTA